MNAEGEVLAGEGSRFRTENQQSCAQTSRGEWTLRMEMRSIFGDHPIVLGGGVITCRIALCPFFHIPSAAFVCVVVELCVRGVPSLPRSAPVGPPVSFSPVGLGPRPPRRAALGPSRRGD